MKHQAPTSLRVVESGCLRSLPASSPSRKHVNVDEDDQDITPSRRGRPPRGAPHRSTRAHLRDAGHTMSDIVAKTGITRSSLYRHLPPRPTASTTVADSSELRS